VAVLALALAAPAQALGAEITDQPADTVRTEVIHVAWTDESPEAAPQVLIEHRHGLDWETAADDDTATLTVRDDGDGLWSARWLPTRYTPSGAYRVRIEGEGYSLVSDVFEVEPCECIVPGPIRARRRDGVFRLRMTADYAPLTAGGFLLLPKTVQTGRPVVRVLRDGRRVGTVRMRYRSGAFRGAWKGPRGPRNSLVFQLVSLTDAFGNS